jgi:hypothetical protein
MPCRRGRVQSRVAFTVHAVDGGATVQQGADCSGIPAPCRRVQSLYTEQLDEATTGERNNEGKDTDKLAYVYHTTSPHSRTPRGCGAGCVWGV